MRKNGAGKTEDLGRLPQLWLRRPIRGPRGDVSTIYQGHGAVYALKHETLRVVTPTGRTVPGLVAGTAKPELGLRFDSVPVWEIVFLISDTERLVVSVPFGDAYVRTPIRLVDGEWADIPTCEARAQAEPPLVVS